MKNNLIKVAPTVSAVACVAAAIGLLVAGFVVAPRGEIHSSVQVILGELLTFAGAIFGISKSDRKPGSIVGMHPGASDSEYPS